MKLKRLSGRKTCEHLLRHGNTWKGTTMIIRWLPGPPKNLTRPEHGFFVGTFASSKLHASAVKRNRMRRRCREAMRNAVRERTHLPTTQLLLTPRSRSLTCDYRVILAEVHAFLSGLPS